MASVNSSCYEAGVIIDFTVVESKRKKVVLRKSLEEAEGWQIVGKSKVGENDKKVSEIGDWLVMMEMVADGRYQNSGKIVSFQQKQESESFEAHKPRPGLG